MFKKLFVLLPLLLILLSCGGSVVKISVSHGNDKIIDSKTIVHFGKVIIGNTSAIFTFTIKATIDVDEDKLNLTGSPNKIKKDGSDSAMFTIDETNTKSPLAHSDTTTFTVTFSPTSSGLKKANIRIPCDSTNEKEFNFEITGYGHNPGSSQGWLGGGIDGWQTINGATMGTDVRSFAGLRGNFVDSNGDIYAADAGNHRICKWDENGNAIGWIGGGSNGWKIIDTPSNNEGNDYQSFNTPTSVAIDSSGNIYVSDTMNNRVCKWDSAGNSVGWIGNATDGWQTTDAVNISGNDYKSFYNNFGLCLDDLGNIYVTDNGNSRVCKWDSSGNAFGWIGGDANGWQTGAGTTPGANYQQFSTPCGIYWHANNIYICEVFSSRVSKWSDAGTALGWIGGGSNGWKVTPGSAQSSDYQSFSSPYYVNVDSQGNIFVAEYTSHRISKWNSAGDAIGWIGNSSIGWKTSNGANSGNDKLSFFSPTGISVDSSGFIYVSDETNHRLCKWED